MKSNLELEKSKHMKNCVNFIRRHKICRVWDVSLSNYLPNACEFLDDKKWVTAKRFATLWDYFGNRASNLFQNEKKPLRRLKV